MTAPGAGIEPDARSEPDADAGAPDGCDRRRSAVVGRHARLELTFERRRGRTVVTHAYAEPPFCVGRSWESAGTLSLIVAWSAPGLFAGDRLTERIRVGGGACVQLVSQSALQVHPSPAGADARLTSDYEIGAAGELYCHWDPLIPFARSRLEQLVAVRLASTSRLYWSEALMSGRTARGENWQFGELAQELRVVVDGRLDYLERHRVTPGDRQVSHPWAAGDARYLGTAIAHHATATEAVARALHEDLARADQLRAGVDVVATRLVVARLAGRHGPGFAAARALVGQSLLADLILAGRLPLLPW